MGESPGYETLLRDLERDPSLVLFLGAGVSADVIPTWGLLLEKLVESAVGIRLDTLLPKGQRDFLRELMLDRVSLTPYEKGALVKRLLGRQYLPVLRGLLYQRLTKKLSDTEGWLRRREGWPLLMGPVVDLCLSRAVPAVVTYNYDDLLELILDNAYSVYGKRRQWLGRGRLPVYHVHGCLPYRESRVPDAGRTSIVLAQEEYFQSMLEPFAWQTTTQLDFLTNHICLFIGASVSDLNMLRVLSHARAYRGNARTYVIMSREDIGDGPKSPAGEGGTADSKNLSQERRDSLARVRSSLLDDVGVKLVISGESRKSAAECLRKIHEVMAE